MASPAPHAFRHEAMATWFELRVVGDDAGYARQAAAEAFRRIDAIEGRLSRYRESSEVSALAGLKPGERLRLHPDTLHCLGLSLELQALTGGAFDPALGGGPQWEPGQLALDAQALDAICVSGRVQLDLGAIGKGFALDCAAEVLCEWGVEGALLIAGGSSILACGESPEPWVIGITSQADVLLQRGSVGCSGLAVKGQHILDPRTRQPAVTPARAWALSQQAAVSDALSTAFMLLPDEEIAAVCAERPEVGAALQENADSPELRRFGTALGVHHAWRLRS